MAKFLCDFRFLLLLAAGVFIYIQVCDSLTLTLCFSFWWPFSLLSHVCIWVVDRVLIISTVLQMRLFATQSEYADRLAAAVSPLYLFSFIYTLILCPCYSVCSYLHTHFYIYIYIIRLWISDFSWTVSDRAFRSEVLNSMSQMLQTTLQKH